MNDINGGIIIMSVKIDKYVLKFEQSPKVIIFDNMLQRNICSVNTLNKENNEVLAEILLNELNTGKYEEEEIDPNQKTLDDYRR